MKQITIRKRTITINTFFAALLCVALGLSLFSFTPSKITGGFFNELGISKTDADQKIAGHILGGYIDVYGARTAKKIALGNRAAVVNELLSYTKQFVKSDVFIQEYKLLKENEKPKQNKLQSPGEMKSSMLETYKKSIADTEASLKKADANMKPIFESVLAAGKTQLKELEDPKNKMFADYESNYPMMVKQFEESNKRVLEEWEMKYPTNQVLFVKSRLQQFLEETKDIDYSAPLIEKNGKKYFVSKIYEGKSQNWKMGFRAGKEVVEPARAFVQQWIKEIGDSM